MSTIGIPESQSPQLHIALKWIQAFNEVDYEMSDAADDFLQYTIPLSRLLPPVDTDEYLANITQYRLLFKDDFVQDIKEIIECPGKVFVYLIFEAESKTGYRISHDVLRTFHFKLDKNGVLKISSLYVFVDSQAISTFYPEEFDRLAAMEEETGWAAELE